MSMKSKPSQFKSVPAGTGQTCGCSGNPKFDGLDPAYKRVLWAVIIINAAMFLAEMSAGKLAGSQALQADALDFLGVNGGVKTCHWGGAKAGQFGVRALERAALK